MNAQQRRRRRLLASSLSLLLLLLLLGGWYAVQGTKKEGKIASISTAEVKVTINPTEPGQPAPGQPAVSPITGAPEASPIPGRSAAVKPTSTPSRSARQPPLLAEVLGETIEATPRASSQAVPLAPTATEPESPPEPENEAPPGSEDAALPGASPDASPVASPVSSQAPGAAAPTPDAGGGGKPAKPPLFTGSNIMGPGGYATGGLKVTNSGSGPFAFSLSLTTAGSSAFANALKLRIYARVGAACNYPGQPSAGDAFLPLSATALYEGNFATGDKVGSPALELAPGDRALSPGQSEVRCMEILFPSGAGPELQNATVDGTFTITAKSPQ